MSNWLKLIVIIEALSLTTFLVPDISIAFFVLICLGVFLATIINLRYGLYLALLELFIGGQGYLFSLPYHDGFILSIRQAIFIIVVGAAILLSFRQKSFDFTQSRFYFSYFLLFAAVFFGFWRGVSRGLAYQDIFFDANAYFFLAFLIVFYKTLRNKTDWQSLFNLFAAASGWLSFKTLAVFYIFSHNFQVITPLLYKWIRDTRVGEITPVVGGFYRIFFQSHIFLVFWLIIAAALLLYQFRTRLNFAPPAGGQNLGGQARDSWHVLIISLLALSAVILSLSRSFWLGLSVSTSLLLLTAWIYLRLSIAQIILAAAHFALIAVVSLSLVTFISYLPFGEPNGFSLFSLLRNRTTSLTEAAAKSRWQLWPPLWQGIKDNWFFGGGFGSTVTYRSLDPRVLAASPDGLRTTYSFEWGWLDIWFKMGAIGLIIYLLLLYKIFKRGLWWVKIALMRHPERKEKSRPATSDDSFLAALPLGLSFTLTALVIIHFFTPYLNHPLGLVWFMLLTIAFDYAKFAPIKSR